MVLCAWHIYLRRRSNDSNILDIVGKRHARSECSRITAPVNTRHNPIRHYCHFETIINGDLYSFKHIFFSYSGHTSGGAGLSDGVFNGPASSVWASNGEANNYIIADLGSVVTISRIDIAPIPATFEGWGAGYLTNTNVDTSTDGSVWTNRATTPGTLSESALTAVTFSPVSARYVRLQKSGWLALSEFQVTADVVTRRLARNWYWLG